MYIENEEDLLDEQVRKQIIEEIESAPNRARKDKAYKAHQCYKDKTAKYVEADLVKQFDQDTVDEMRYSITGLAFIKKIVNKLARVYNYGIEREVSRDKNTTLALQIAEKESDVNRSFKKANRFLKLQKNCVQYLVPKRVGFSKDSKLYTIKSSVLPPYLYDAVSQADDPEKAGAYILSDFSPSSDSNVVFKRDAGIHIGKLNKEMGGAEVPLSSLVGGTKNGPNEKEKKTYTWWSDNYHFVTNHKGAIIKQSDDDEGLNPIQTMPFVSYAEDQDNAFWAEGGDDLVDGGINANSLISNIIHIAIVQGFGQMVMIGEDTPENLKVGPNKIIKLVPTGEGDKTSFKFESANPPIAQLIQLVEVYVALLLTTNNLSTSGVSSSLNSSNTFASGVALMLDKAESMEDIDDQRQIFSDNEPVYWDIYSLWHGLYKEQLVDSLKKINFKDGFTDKLSLKYGQPKVIISEKENLEVLKIKKEMGLIGQVDLLRSEYPELSDKDLAVKLEELLTEALERKNAALESAQPAEGKEDDAKEREDDSNESEDGDGSGPEDGQGD